LANLLENAIKYSPEGGTVEASASASGNAIRFSVRDQGIGIPEPERERIFEKFTRLDPQMSRGIGGTGLGLYICRQLVEAMGGRIWVESAEGEGASFAFELPAVRE
jgi:two-component system sensor histidine kinase VicK